MRIKPTLTLSSTQHTKPITTTTPISKQALRLIQQSAAATDDAHSQATAAAALAAVAPAWAAAGRDPSELWGALAGALGEVPPHRRLALLAALLRALPKVSRPRQRGACISVCVACVPPTCPLLLFVSLFFC